jgi:hypothetical protein
VSFADASQATLARGNPAPADATRLAHDVHRGERALPVRAALCPEGRSAAGGSSVHAAELPRQLAGREEPVAEAHGGGRDLALPRPVRPSGGVARGDAHRPRRVRPDHAGDHVARDERYAMPGERGEIAHAFGSQVGAVPDHAQEIGQSREGRGRRRDDRRDFDPGLHQLAGQLQEQRAVAAHGHGPVRNHAIAPQQARGAAHGEHAGEGPPRHREGGVVGACGDDQLLRLEVEDTPLVQDSQLEDSVGAGSAPHEGPAQDLAAQRAGPGDEGRPRGGATIPARPDRFGRLLVVLPAGLRALVENDHPHATLGGGDGRLQPAGAGAHHGQLAATAGERAVGERPEWR